MLARLSSTKVAQQDMVPHMELLLAGLGEAGALIMPYSRNLYERFQARRLLSLLLFKVHPARVAPCK